MKRFTVLAAIWIVLCYSDEARAQKRLRFDFEQGGTAEWTEIRLARRSNRFEIVSGNGGSAVRAVSENAASALSRPVDVDLGGRAVVRWRWKVLSTIAGNRRERDREGDDYAARFFVVFGDGSLERGTRAICYVWASHEPVGSTYENPFFESVATVVLESGDEQVGEWLVEERDFVADYRRFFGERPMTLGAVVLMVDTDNTGSRAVAWFDDILVTVPTADSIARD